MCDPCTNPIFDKWHFCRPCVLGFHSIPCEQFQAEDFPTIQLGCRRCGYERIEHVA